MKGVLRTLFFNLVVFLGVNFAQIIFEENFDYTATAGDSLKAKGWLLSGTNNLNPIMVTSPGLTFTGYPSVKGNATSIRNTGQDIYKSFTPAVSSGSIYLAFLMNVQSASAIGDYFIALSPTSSQTNYYARTHIKSSGSGFQIGLSKSNELAGGYVYGTTVLDFNKTYVVVIKHTFVAVDKNDEERIFVFSTTIPSTEPGTSEVGPYVETTKSDPADLNTITLRQGGSFTSGVLTNPGPELKLDGFRIATSWNVLFTTTGVEENKYEVPNTFELLNNYPNPFNPSTKINYVLPNQSDVQISIFDVTGKEIKSFVFNSQQSGSQTVQWDGKNNLGQDLTSGTYIYSISVKSLLDGKTMQKSSKLMLMK